jgi:hypothetical protein
MMTISTAAVFGVNSEYYKVESNQKNTYPDSAVERVHRVARAHLHRHHRDVPGPARSDGSGLFRALAFPAVGRGAAEGQHYLEATRGPRIAVVREALVPAFGLHQQGCRKALKRKRRKIKVSNE